MNSQPSVSYVQQADPFLKRCLIDLIETSSGRGRLTSIYRELSQQPFSIHDFFSRAIELGRLDLQYNREAENLIPREGPLVFIANHPFGIADGLILCDLAARTRGDFRILLNNRLLKDDIFNDLFLPVDFDGTKDATLRNIQTKRKAEALLDSGGTLIIFPAGGVATRTRFGTGPLEELPWTTFTAKLVMRSRCSVVPVHFVGENSWLFHFVSAFSSSLRLSLFVREVARQIGTTIRFSIGKPVTSDQFEHMGGRLEMTRFLRLQVEQLKPAEICQSAIRELPGKSHGKQGVAGVPS